MDTRNGQIYNSIKEVEDLDRHFVKRMKVPPTEKQRRKMKIGRNEQCPCGSGEKFKRCCMFRIARGEVPHPDDILDGNA